MNITDMLNDGLKSMELPKKTEEEKKKATEICCESDNKYPWGLSIDLNEDSLEALGKGSDAFDIDKEVILIVKCNVDSVSKRERKDQKPSESVCLQITDMKIHEEMSDKNTHEEYK